MFDTSTIQLIVWPLTAYFIGSISSAVIVTKLFRIEDPRETGSGNPGATNVLRSGNKIAAVLTLLGDLAKGIIPVLLAQHYQQAVPIIALVAIAAFMGHLYPVFLKFKGGKGVATAIGVFTALSWQLVVVFVGTWFLIAAITRYSSLAALIASAVSAMASFAIFNQREELQLVGAVFLIVAFLFKRHRENIDRLKAGTETKIGASK
jgi:glycerol-3-phosphate acyltransferase PlsY